jgi:hypothetical protein
MDWQTKSYVELASGLHYWKDGEWVESKEEIELFQGGAVARNGQHQVIFAPNINSAGAIDLLTADGKRLRSHVLGLAYTDAATGQAVMIAEIKDSIGQLTAPNQITYPDTFTDFKADLRYTYTRGGFEQDVILLENPPSPLDYGLNPDTTRLEVYTEFLAPPAPGKATRVLKAAAKNLRGKMVEPDLIDEILDFGLMQIGSGNAFPLRDNKDKSVPVGKSWEVRDGRTILIEKVDYKSVKDYLDVLPKSAAVKRNGDELMAKVQIPRGGNRVADVLLPRAPGAKEAAVEAITRMAKVSGDRQGLVLDYILLTTSSNHIFKGDSTYFLSGTVTLSGTTTLEGGAVIKFTNGANSKLVITGPLDCRTAPYYQAIFTGKDDDSVGEAIAGSTGNPSGYYALRALELNNSGYTYDLHNIRIRYASRGIYVTSGTKLVLKHSQIGLGDQAIENYGDPLIVQNLLAHKQQSGISSTKTSMVEHATFHNVGTLFSGPASDYFRLTNCLAFAVTNGITFVGENNAVDQDDTGVFQTVGGGSHYLADGSLLRNYGITNLSPSMLAALKMRTTYPPMVYSNISISNFTTFSIYALRDTDLPDLGYHYDPLDHAFGGVHAYADLTFTPGTAAAWFRTSSGWFHAGHGIHMDDRKIITFDGRADAPTYWIRSKSTQEGGNGLWDGHYGPGGITSWADQSSNDVTRSPEIRARFTRFVTIAAGGNHFRDDWGYLIVRATDCEFWSGWMGGYVIGWYYTNCLMTRANGGNVAGFPGNEIYMRNCTWNGGIFNLNRYNFAVPVNVVDSAFDGTTFDVNDAHATNAAVTFYDYNAFLTGAQRLTPTGAHDIIVGSFNWQTSWLGRYYLPTNSALINAGSLSSAATRGLYHHTTQTNQVKEGTSYLDIGYHYIAVNSQGQPIDTDNDGIPDYIEDTDGDGVQDPGETIVSTPDSPFVVRYEPLGPSSRRTPLIISEIMHTPAGGGEFIELYNTHYLAQNISGFRLASPGGPTYFTFGANTNIGPGQFVVVTPTTGLGGEGTLELLNASGAVLLHIEYDDDPPWPEETDNVGHSLVLARPSYGENSIKAWAASERRGGSPGFAETNATDFLRAVRINEFSATGTDFIELFNSSSQTIDLSGCWLSDEDDTLNKFQMPLGTVIPARGFISFTGFGFGLQDAGEFIFFTNPDFTRVIDAVEFGPQTNGVSTGRYPNGAPSFHQLASPTSGASNNGLLIRDIVINEIMFNPVSRDSNDEYIELFNKGATVANLSGWELTGVGNFTGFQTITNLAPGGFVVVARDTNRLASRYPNLVLGVNLVGNYTGELANSGERIALLDPSDRVIDEVIYGDGGRWCKWADGRGASLELIDARSDNRLAPNWADSVPPTTVIWTNITKTGPLVFHNGLPINALEIILQGDGECLIDDVQVTVSSVNYVSNPSLNSGSTSWSWEGTHDMTFWTNGGGISGSGCLYMRANGGGDYFANRVFASLTTSLSSSGTFTIGGNVRWLRGRPEILFRLRGNGMEVASALIVPNQLGTPGQTNSVRLANVGPAIHDISHFPVLPAGYQPVQVTARVHDSDGVGTVTLVYRVDPSTTTNNLTMYDNGTNGDGVAGDGIYTAVIPGQVANTIVAFHILATDGAGTPASTRYPIKEAVYPGDTLGRECLVRCGDPEPGGTMGIYRLWVNNATLNQWINRPKIHNGLLDITFAYGNHRAIYNAGACYSGSEGGVTWYSTPTGYICSYNLGFPKDDRFLGALEANLDIVQWDKTGQREVLAYWIADRLGMAFNNRRYVRVMANGVENNARFSFYGNMATVYMDSQEPDSDLLTQWFPNADVGELFKIHHFIYDDGWPMSGSTVFGRLDNYADGNGVKQTQRYRWIWKHRGVQATANSYSNLFELVDTMQTNDSAFRTNFAARADFEQWMRVLAFHRVIGNNDTYGRLNAHNAAAYWPSGPNKLWKLLLWDVELCFFYNSEISFSGDEPTDALYSASEATPNGDPNLNRLMATPEFERAFWRLLKEAVDGPMATGNADVAAEGTYTFLYNNDQKWSGRWATDTIDGPIESEDNLASWIADRRAFIQTEISNRVAPFEISNNGGANYTTGVATETLIGKAPIEKIKFIRIQGRSTNELVNWTTLTNWSFSLPLNMGANNVTVLGLDRFEAQVSGASDSITITRQ